jgi:tetratricopeptide (TPR) repeat protein
MTCKGCASHRHDSKGFIAWQALLASGPFPARDESIMVMSLILLTLALPMQASAERDQQFAAAKSVYANRAKLSEHVASVGEFAKLAERYPADQELQIWCARTAYYASHRIGDSVVKKKVASRGITCAKRVVAKKKSDYDGRLWFILCRFRYEQSKGVVAGLKAAPSVMKFIAKMAKDDPNRPEAFFMLGVIYGALPPDPISIGDKDKALKLLKKADSMSPNHPEILLELAGLYRAMGKVDKARVIYHSCIKSTGGEAVLSWENQDARDYAKKMLAELD